MTDWPGVRCEPPAEIIELLACEQSLCGLEQLAFFLSNVLLENAAKILDHHAITVGSERVNVIR